jgi:hypothetical protein
MSTPPITPDDEPHYDRSQPEALRDCVQHLRTYITRRSNAHKARLAGLSAHALPFEAEADALHHAAAARDEPCALWDAVVEACDLLVGTSFEYCKADWIALLPDTPSLRRERLEARVNKVVSEVPSKADGDILLAKGYDPRSWAPYIIAQADDCGVSVSRALTIWSAFGPTEAFDGFVTTLQDMEGDDA